MEYHELQSFMNFPFKGEKQLYFVKVTKYSLIIRRKVCLVSPVMGHGGKSA